MASFPPLRADLGVMEGYHSAQVDVEVRLNVNESPFPPPDGFFDQLAKHVQTTSFHRYPDRQATELRQALARVHGVRPEQIFIANGSNEVLQCLQLAFAGPGRPVATFEPTYAMHGTVARMVGAPVLEAERADDFSIDPAEVARICAADPAPSLTFICNPNNPTGMAETKESITALLAAVPGLLVVDEAYGQFADWSALALIDDDTPLVVTRTFSKTWSMAASRLGYCVGPERVIKPLWEKAALPYHLDSLKQVAGLVALEFVEEMELRVAQLIKGRERILDGLAGLGIETFPSQANFVLFRVEETCGKAVWQGLVDRSVLVRDCSGWPRLAGCLRVTVGTPEENERFLEALDEVMAAQGSEAAP